jgi:ribosomal protein S18 acetylase RimI-like enzyme
VSRAAAAVAIRDLGPADLDGVVRIDGEHTGQEKRAYWSRVLRDFLRRDGQAGRVGVAAAQGEALLGYLLGEVRAFEFGSEPCGWVFAVGVDRRHLRAGVASALLAEACRRFREAGVRRVRTMVRRSDVPVLSFFRAQGFVGGSFIQLELDLEEGP